MNTKEKITTNPSSLISKRKQSGFKKFFTSSTHSMTFRLLFSYGLGILLMILLGVVSYKQAAKSIIKTTEHSTVETINAVSDYLSLGFDNVDRVAMEILAQDDMRYYYLNPSLDINAPQGLSMRAFSRIRTDINQTISMHTFIENIHLFGEVGVGLSTQLTLNEHSFQEFIDGEQGLSWYESESLTGWSSNHDYIDNKAQGDARYTNYAITMYRKSLDHAAMIIMDINQDIITENLKKINFGAGSWSAFIAPGGKQTLLMGSEDGNIVDLTDNDPSTDATSSATTEHSINFTEFDFYNEAIESEDTSGFKNIKYEKENYLFTWSKISNADAFICALIPQATILSNVRSIRVLTIIIIIITSVIFALAGGYISFDLTSSVERINGSLEEAAAGDLTVEFEVNRKDEFGKLAKGVTNMLSHMRLLIKEVEDVSTTISASADDLSRGTTVILDSSRNISLAMEEVEGGATEQARDTETSLVQMSYLGERIDDVYSSTHAIESTTNKAKTITSNGLEIVDTLSESSKIASDMTQTVIEGIEKLSIHSQAIGSIIDVINDIASQTNLLSLNASIEAARAGEYGLGFSVVAEEIRSLADDSLEASKKISNIIRDIQDETKSTVVSAKQAEETHQSQAIALDNTVHSFQDISSHIENLVDDLNIISTGVKEIENAKNDTLNSIQNISAVAQQSAAASEEVNATSIEQLDAVTYLSEAADALLTDANRLNDAISIFTTSK